MIMKLPQMAWESPQEQDFFLPDSWDVTVGNIAGHDRLALSDDQIRASIGNPIGTPPIRELAKGKKEVAIIIDDMTRVTRIAKIVPHILNELSTVGIADGNIRFISALGSHGTMDRTDFAKKLGEETVARFPCYNHNAFNNCTYIGTTSYGNEVHINTEVMKCDFKIAIGSITPHPRAIFSGGGKIILPGVASIETIVANHTLPSGDDYRSMPRNIEKEEAARMAGLDMLIECIYNMWGDSVAIFAGAESQAHAAAVEDARSHYRTDKAESQDIVIANAYAKASEAYIASRAAASLSQSGGDLVVIANAPEGQVSHYLMGRWGKNLWGQLNKQAPLPTQINHLIWYSQYPEASALKSNEAPGRMLLMSKWDDVIAFLSERYQGGTKVAVYPSADIQYFG
jgi:nickel-dependent lactate racemase